MHTSSSSMDIIGQCLAKYALRSVLNHRIPYTYDVATRLGWQLKDRNIINISNNETTLISRTVGSILMRHQYSFEISDWSRSDIHLKVLAVYSWFKVGKPCCSTMKVCQLKETASAKETWQIIIQVIANVLFNY